MHANVYLGFLLMENVGNLLDVFKDTRGGKNVSKDTRGG